MEYPGGDVRRSVECVKADRETAKRFRVAGAENLGLLPESEFEQGGGVCKRKGRGVMDFTSEGAALDLFRIGPTSTIGRAFAIQIVFWKEFREVLQLLLASIVYRWRWIRKWLRYGLRRLLWLVNPRRPSVILAAVVGTMIWFRRAKMVTAKEEQKYRRIFWSDLMQSASTYEEWAHSASMLDKAMNRKRDEDLFDEDLVRAKLSDLRRRRLEGGVGDILFCLRADLVRNLGNMCNPEVHKGRLQTPRVIQEYINEVRYHLRAVCETDSEEFPIDEKLAFIHETRHAFGRTALLLSGGAALGAFHLGVVRTLIEHRLLPRVVAGASVGSITCSFTATRTWMELQSFFDDPIPPMRFFESMGSIIATAHRLLTKKCVHDIGSLQRQMRQLIGDLTFQEAYDLSGRVLGISVSSPRKHEPPRCLNYLTSPHVVIWSAVTASCAFPGLFEAQELMAKDRQGRMVPYHGPTLGGVGLEDPNNLKRQWRDGSLESDLPMMQLKELFNVNHFVVSQANPHIAPLLRLKELTRVYGGDFAAKLAHIAEMEVKHRCNQALEMGFQLYGVAKLFAQEWEGDVTIVMPATFAQFTRIIQNPTASELRTALMQGRRVTWAKLSAIQANCGIELMLDECVAELSRRRRAQQDNGRGTHVEGRFGRGPTAKRIPSWNIMARESSCGSLDDDGEHVQAGGPWGGPSLHSLRQPQNRDGSDSDSGAENVDTSNLSWTRIGGPLMKSASALKFVSGSDNEMDSTEQFLNAVAPQDSGDDVEVGFGRTHETRLVRLMKVHSWEFRNGKRANQISINPGSSGYKSEDNDATEEQDSSFRFGVKRSPSARSEEALLSRDTPSADGVHSAKKALSARIAGKFSDEDEDFGNRLSRYEGDSQNNGMTKSGSSWHLDIMYADPSSPLDAQNPERIGILEIADQELLNIRSMDSSEAAEAEGRSLERGAFGSFLEDSPKRLDKANVK